jgi:hypothetical protein
VEALLHFREFALPRSTRDLDLRQPPDDAMPAHVASASGVVRMPFAIALEVDLRLTRWIDRPER